MSTAKRKSNFETPAPKAAKAHLASSPTSAKVSATSARGFADREKAGEIDETINSHIEHPEPLANAPSEARIKLKANTDLPKFAYKTMAMKLSEASELLDDRIEEFVALVQEHHKLEESDLGDPTRESQNEIVTVGRIASDLQEGKLNLASLVLETQRRRGNGIRVPLKVDKLQSYDFFPGKIVALRGTNASGDFFSVSEVLEVPRLMHVASAVAEIDGWNSRLERDDGEDQPLTVLMASGPYTTEDTLDFSPFQALCKQAEELKADSLILLGPFLDIEHPLVRHGDFDLPSDFAVSPDQATINDVFRYHISLPLQKLAKALPSITMIMCPSVRDAVSKHAAWPQDRFPKKELGLPKQVSVVSNPMTISLNEIMLGMSSLDVLDQLRATGVGNAKGDFLARLCQNVLQQRHYFPIFPPLDRQSLESSTAKDNDGMDLDYKTVGASLDISYSKLGEITTGLDVLALPSTLKPFVKASTHRITTSSRWCIN
jgi:DNA polymerase alpha subunit B